MQTISENLDEALNTDTNTPEGRLIADAARLHTALAKSFPAAKLNRTTISIGTVTVEVGEKHIKVGTAKIGRGLFKLSIVVEIISKSILDQTRKAYFNDLTRLLPASFKPYTRSDSMEIAINPIRPLAAEVLLKDGQLTVRCGNTQRSTQAPASPSDAVTWLITAVQALENDLPEGYKKPQNQTPSWDTHGPRPGSNWTGD